MNSLKVLDVTLRDGGCVNNFDFGQDYMEKILCALEHSGVEHIELGYLDQKKGSVQGRTQYCNEKVIPQHFLKKKKAGVTYVAMMDYGKFDVDALGVREPGGIDGIRLAFHKKDRKKIAELGHIIMSKGYQFFIQPMITLRYSDQELLELIEMVNTELADASGFYIVDSFGEMRPNDMNRVLNLVDHNLMPSMTLGFHSHNNLQMSYSNAISFVQFPTNRNLMLDCSIMGMGKGAGNLNTELLLEHLNLYYGKGYTTAPLLSVIDQVINQLHSEFYWGYAVEYYLSAINQCTPSYAGHFFNKHMLPIDQVGELLSMIREDKKISFDRDYAESLYYNYNASREYDDSDSVAHLREWFKEKTILLIGPGKSVEKDRDKILAKINESDTISISVNYTGLFSTDLVFVTRAELLSRLDSVSAITMSNIASESKKNLYVISYKKWAVAEGTTKDSAGVILLHLLSKCSVKEAVLAGFDGFVPNINDNYFDRAMRHPVTETQANERNRWFKEYIRKMSDFMRISFLTDSLYQ